MTVDRLVFDASAQVTPPEILARGQTPGWQGISIAEATLFLPPNTPLVDKINVAVKDVLLGSPAGLQGEIQVELGRTPINAAAVEFLQDFAGRGAAAHAHGQLAARSRSRSSPAPPARAGCAHGSTRRRWGRPPSRASPGSCPAAASSDANDSGWFTASVGETMGGQYSEEVGGERVSDLPNSYTFVQSEPTLEHPATVNVHVGSVDIANVVSVSGTSDDLFLLEFESALNPADAADLRWQHGEGSDAPTRTGPDFVLWPSDDPGTSYVVVTDSKKRTRRIRVDVLAQGPLLIGAADGVHDATGAKVDLRGVENTYGLAAFHRDGSLNPFATPATLSGSTVTVPRGGLAEVTLEQGTGTDPVTPPPPVTEEDARRLEILFEYGLSNPVTRGAYWMRTPVGTSIEDQVRAWSAFFPGATFVVIGRCCDLSSDTFNATLATDRANAVKAWLPSASDHGAR